MKHNKFSTLALASTLCLSLLTACGSSDSGTTTPSTNTTPSTSTTTPANNDTTNNNDNKSDISQYVMDYPQTMKDLGFTEPLVLEERPQAAAVLTTAAVLALHELEVPLVAYPATSLVQWPAEMVANGTELPSLRADDFDIELVIVLNPDLVVLGRSNQETFGAILEDAGYPVYYVDDGHTVSYHSVKELTVELINAFGVDSDGGQAMLDSFEAVETRINNFAEEHGGKSVMVLQSSPPSHYLQSSGGTLGSMLDQLGYENVYDGTLGSMALIDYEAALSYDPDMVFAVGSSATSEEFRAIMEDSFTDNQAYWDAIDAIANGDIIYLPVGFVSSAGIAVIDNINDLIDIIEG